MMKKLIVLLVLSCLGIGIARADHATYDEARAAARKKAEAGQYAAARKDYEEAVALARTPAERGAALLRIGETYKVEGKRTDARSWWNKVVEMPDAAAPDRLTAYFAIGISYLDDNKPAEARAQLTRIAERKDMKLQAHEKVFLGLSIGTTYFREKNYTQARKEWDQVLTSGYKGPAVAPILQSIQLAYADSYMEEENYTQARVEFNNVLKVEVDASLPAGEQQQLRVWKQNAQLQFAGSYLLEKNYPKAKEEYQKVLHMEPPVPEYRAEAEKQLKRIAEQGEGPPK
jgi:tetratricopeptide (TPR) repeat protein